MGFVNNITDKHSAKDRLQLHQQDTISHNFDTGLTVGGVAKTHSYIQRMHFDFNCLRRNRIQKDASVGLGDAYSLCGSIPGFVKNQRNLGGLT